MRYTSVPKITQVAKEASSSSPGFQSDTSCGPIKLDKSFGQTMFLRPHFLQEISPSLEISSSGGIGNLIGGAYDSSVPLSKTVKHITPGPQAQTSPALSLQGSQAEEAILEHAAFHNALDPCLQRGRLLSPDGIHRQPRTASTQPAAPGGLSTPHHQG